MRLEIHVRPGASTTWVGGTHDGTLVVHVAQPPDAGRATDAAMTAVAKALGVPRRSVTLVFGATSRRKVLEIDAGSAHADDVVTTLEKLRRSS
jgi:hypothetical protein